MDLDDEYPNAKVFEDMSVDSATLQINKSVLKLFTKLYSDPKLSRNFVQTLLSDIEEVIRDSVVVVKSVLNEEPENIVAKYEEAVLSPFKDFSSEHKRLKALEKMGYLTYPEEYLVGVDVTEKRTKSGSKTRIVKEMTPFNGQMIPIKITLKKFFEQPGVFETVYNYMVELENDHQLLSNFVQAELWRSKKEEWYQDKIVFPLLVYHDDFEVNMALGSHTGVQSLGGTYLTIPCLPPEFRSTVDNIFLALLFHTADRKKFGNDPFRCLVDQISELQENGVELDLPDGMRTVYFALGLVTGDNVGLSCILGFMESLGATYFCRLCKIRKEDSQKSCSCNLGPMLRNEENYAEDAGQGKSSGVKENSVWNGVGKGFHVTRNFYVDVAHDLDEGVWRYDMSHIVNHFVFFADTKVPLEILNDRLRTFDYYGNGLTNRPPLLSEDEVRAKHFRMSASEMHTFVLIFAFLVGDLVDTDDEVWYFYQLMRKINDIVYAPKIQREVADYLNVLVSEHHRLYIKLFRDTLKPKFHNMLHYGMVLRMSGPLCLLSTLRCESKNKQFKVRAKSTNSRRNIAYTLSLKEQLEFGYRLLSTKKLEPKLEMGPCSSIEQNVFVSLDGKTEVPLPPGFSEESVQVPWVDHKGTVYRQGCYVAYDVDCFERPLFGLVEGIICNSDLQVNFFLRCCKTFNLNESLCAFQIVDGHDYCFVGFQDLLSFSPCIHVVMGDGREFVSPRNAL